MWTKKLCQQAQWNRFEHMMGHMIKFPLEQETEFTRWLFELTAR